MSDLTDWAAEVVRLHDEMVRLMTRNRELESALRVAEASAAFGERNLERHRNAGMQRRMDAVREFCEERAEVTHAYGWLGGEHGGWVEVDRILALLDGYGEAQP